MSPSLSDLDRSRLSRGQRRYVEANERDPHSRMRGFRFERWDSRGRPVFSLESSIAPGPRIYVAVNRLGEPTDPAV